MFAVIFEVQPDPDQWETYLAHARMLRPELEQIDGFVDNIRYRSLTRDGWILSLSGWRDEKALIRWRTRANHHDMQQKGRGGSGAVRWDVFDAMLFPGQVVVLATWRDRPAAEAFEAAVALPDGARLRRIRVIREYGMFDRREAPQYYPAVTRVRSGA